MRDARAYISLGLPCHDNTTPHHKSKKLFSPNIHISKMWPADFFVTDEKQKTGLLVIANCV